MDIVERLQETPELTPAQYWEAQASMWHENYKEAADEIERLREVIENMTNLSNNLWHIGFTALKGDE